MNSDKKPPSPPDHDAQGDLGQNPEVDEFFTRMNYGMRRPKPGQEAIAAAFDAIQRLALEVDTEESVNEEQSPSAQNQCGVCNAPNRPQNRFCASCGVPLSQSRSLPPQPEVAEEESIALIPSQDHRIRREAPGQHHYHHHYHHHYFASSEAGFGPGPEMGGVAAPRENTMVRAPLTGPSLSRAEVAIRKMSQDWALACNTKQLDDILGLYTSDALVLRPNVPPIRGTASIREFFFTALDSGFGEVELEPVRVEIFGEIAYEAGRCKALVPSALGKRREERGKYLVLSTRHNGEWRILSDCWSADLNLGIVGETLPAKPGAQGPNSRLPRKP